MDFCESNGNILLFVKSLKMASERAVFARCLSLFVAFHSLYCGNAVNTTFGLGAMLSSLDNQKVFQSAVDKINANSSSLLRGAILNASSYVLNPNPIRSAMDVCEKLIANGVAVVIVSHPRDDSHRRFLCRTPVVSTGFLSSGFHQEKQSSQIRYFFF